MMESLTKKLMAHPLAASIDIPVKDCDVGALAALHGNLICHGSYQSHCVALAVERFLRGQAIVNFHKPEVLAAVNTVELALSMTDTKRGRGRKRQTTHDRILARGQKREMDKR